jgi:anti-anti-sigma factor
MDWHGHLLLIHHTEQERRAGVSAWVSRGLGLGEKVVYLEPPDEPESRSLVSVLTEQRVPVEAAVARGQVQVLTARPSTYSAEGLADVVDQGLAEGYPGVRLSGEAATADRMMPGPAHDDLEWVTDSLCRTRPVSVLCQYPADRARQALAEVSAMHQDGVRENLLQTARRPGGIVLRGEVDLSNHDVLQGVLRAATLSATDSLVVDLSLLSFLDVSGARALLAGTKDYRRGGGRVRLRWPQHPVDRVLDVCGVGDAGGLQVDNP